MKIPRRATDGVHTILSRVSATDDDTKHITMFHMMRGLIAIGAKSTQNRQTLSRRLRLSIGRTGERANDEDELRARFASNRCTYFEIQKKEKTATAMFEAALRLPVSGMGSRSAFDKK